MTHGTCGRSRLPAPSGGPSGPQERRQPRERSSPRRSRLGDPFYAREGLLSILRCRWDRRSTSESNPSRWPGDRREARIKTNESVRDEMRQCWPCIVWWVCGVTHTAWADVLELFYHALEAAWCQKIEANNSEPEVENLRWSQLCGVSVFFNQKDNKFQSTLPKSPTWSASIELSSCSKGNKSQRINNSPPRLASATHLLIISWVARGEP